MSYIESLERDAARAGEQRMIVSCAPREGLSRS